MQAQSSVQQPPRFPVQAAGQVDHGSVIDAQGREIPITEAMIQTACQALDNCSLATAKRG